MAQPGAARVVVVAVEVADPQRVGAVVAVQTDRGVTPERLLQPLVPSLVASRRALHAGAGDPANRAGSTDRAGKL